MRQAFGSGMMASLQLGISEAIKLTRGTERLEPRDHEEVAAANAL